ncbi:MAG: adenylate/guanylate cyclase domain-containing protein [Gammaproteobacteria bacterium]|nr:adenylate/guanylate cyclase domain-containing protein [Gammaproteobacteria bacterium]
MAIKSLGDKLLAIGLGLGLTLVFAWAEFSDIPVLKSLKQRIEFIAYDLRLNATLPRQEIDRRIVIIDVDEKSLSKEGRWPWPRDKIATLTEKLYDAGTVVIGYDIFFSEPERNPATEIISRLKTTTPQPSRLIGTLQQLAPAFDNDQRLTETLTGRDLTLGYLFHEEKTTPTGELPAPLLKLTPAQAARSGIKEMPNYTINLPMFQNAAASSGFVTTWPDTDGIIRRTPMIIQYGNNIYGSLSLTVAKQYLFLEDVKIDTATIGDIDAVEKIILGGTTINTDGMGFALIPYHGPAGSFPYISAADVLNNNFDPAMLEGAIVLIGSTAVGIADLVATPVENIYPGVEIHATMIKAILDNHFPTEPSWADGANLSATLIVGIILTLLLPLLSPVWLLIISSGIASGIVWFNFWLWQEKGLALALAWPLLLILALAALSMTYGFIRENRKRVQLKNVFGQYVPPQLVETMSQNPEAYSFEGESREMTVLFADIRGFTTLSESLSPNDLRKLLNRYFTAMTEIIFKHQGTIDKYVGDMIMAFWGAPVNDSDHAKHAIEAALEMLAKTDELKPQLLADGFPEINIGIGLNTGMMNVGDMGSSYRRAYTVLGDNVNLASRLEGLTKYYGAGLVVGERTRETADNFVFRQLDQVKVKGKTSGVKVFQPICSQQAASIELISELQHYNEALSAYYQRNWEQAQNLFGELHQSHPQIHLYELYLERIEHLKKRNPGPEWDGVYERREK